MQINEIDRLKELEAQGLTSTCFGFSDTFQDPLERKQDLLQWFADEVMAKF